MFSVLDVLLFLLLLPSPSRFNSLFRPVLPETFDSVTNAHTCTHVFQPRMGSVAKYMLSFVLVHFRLREQRIAVSYEDAIAKRSEIGSRFVSCYGRHVLGVSLRGMVGDRRSRKVACIWATHAFARLLLLLRDFDIVLLACKTVNDRIVRIWQWNWESAEIMIIMSVRFDV